MNKNVSEPYSLLAFLCLVGIGITHISESEGMYYLGIGLTLAGASIKILTKPGAIILVAGILGNIFLKSKIPILFSASALACWYLFEFQFSEHNR